jgi:DNA polymerase-3 subunit beta
MNLTINSQTLATELRLLSKVVPTKPAIVILSHVLFVATDRLTIHATDIEVSLSVTCAARITTPGRAALPVGKLLAMVEQFPAADVSISVEGAQVLIKCGVFKSRMQVLPVEEFPEIPSVSGEISTFDASALTRIVAKTSYAISANAQKHTLRGALLTVSGSAAAMVTTDGKRIAIATAGCSGADMRLIIPAKALDLIPSEGEVEVSSSAHLFFKSGQRILCSRTIDGAFPAYERAIPRDCDKQITIGRTLLTAALRRVIISAEDNAAVYADIAPGSVELSARSAEVGSATEPVPASYEGEPVRICINGEHVLDFLNAATSNEITLALTSSAMLLTDGSDYLSVIMLMR